jgi:plasmid stability protein
MARIRTTVTLDEEILKAVKIRAARQGIRESEVIERALQDALLTSPLEAIWNAQESMEPLSEDEAMALALEAQREVRAERRKKKSGKKAA